MRTITSREHIMMIVAMFAVAAVIYIPLRYRPAKADLAEDRARVVELRNDIARRDIPAKVHADPDALADRIAQMRRTITERMQRVSRLRSSFVDDNSPAAVSALRLAVADLAEASGVRIESFGPGQDQPARTARASDNRSVSVSSTDLLQRADALSTAGDLDQWLVDRPRYELKAVCRFDQLRRFVDELQDLPWTVIITDFQIDTTADQRLRVRLELTV